MFTATSTCPYVMIIDPYTYTVAHYFASLILHLWQCSLECVLTRFLLSLAITFVWKYFHITLVLLVVRAIALNSTKHCQLQ